MERISTQGIFTAALLNLGETQQRQLDAARQVSSQKVAQDLKGYAGKAETLTAMRGAQTRINGLLDQNTVLKNRFTMQDIALGQLSGAAGGARQAITDALASGNVDTLMQDLRGFFTDATAALNTKSQGRYLFSGGQVNTQPSSASAMSDLTLAAPSTYFHNDQFVGTSQIDETSSVQGGMMAANQGLGLYNAFKGVEAFEQGGSGPFTGSLTTAQRTFLEGVLTQFDTAHTTAINAQARNGSVLKRIENTASDLNDRSTTMGGLIGKVTDVDMADAISRLQAAQTAVQASAEVFNVLKNSSLLNFLR